MEIHVEAPNNQKPKGFKRSAKFEINDIEFRDIEVTDDRIKARGKKWNAFELLLAFIGAAWMEKWRRFGVKLAVAGGALIILGMYPIVLSGPYLLTPQAIIYVWLPLLMGLTLIAAWAYVKREALLLFTAGHMFKIEGSMGFVEELWNEVGPRIG